MKNIVNKSILDQIALAKGRLENMPDFNLVRKQRSYSFLKKNAHRHSVDIEGIPSGKAKKIAEENLSLAHDYLTRKCLKDSFHEDDLKVVAGIINNYVSGCMNYRNDSARADHGSKGITIYSSPSDIPNEIYRFFEERKEIKNPVELAVHSHFHLSRIHPFADGNGRLARLVQNSTLDCAGYPPIVIGVYERSSYMDLIFDADHAYREKGRNIASDTAKFFNYLAMKVYDSLEDIGKCVARNSK